MRYYGVFAQFEDGVISSSIASVFIFLRRLWHHLGTTLLRYAALPKRVDAIAHIMSDGLVSGNVPTIVFHMTMWTYMHSKLEFQCADVARALVSLHSCFL